ncbi:UbiA prenyltransferase family protein [Cognatitamlana onchidii]|uniref:hypothetical protein n=1 Tax=Cognatitamlana onchidii TaxID=2562860 RepID=UPI0010A653F7|nr:hypothetical protein [Algibacter onchidii]
MKFAKNLIDFYINSSIHVAFAVYALTRITLINFGIGYKESILYFLFYATITGYNFVKYSGVARFRHRNLADWLRYIQILSFVCFLLMCYYGFQLQIQILALIGVFACLTFFYAMPFFGTKEKTLRSLRGLKIYIIALVWAGVTVLLPIMNEDLAINYNVLLELMQRFIFVIILMIPFEIRDLKFDNIKLHTIPQSLGVKRTKLLGVILLCVFLSIEFFKAQTSSETLFVTGLITVISGLFVGFSSVNQKAYYSAFWVESLPILWLILLFLFM